MAARNARHRWGSATLLAIGVLATTLGVVGFGPASSAVDNSATDGSPTMSEPAVTDSITDTVPDTKPPTTEPPTTEPPTTEPPTTEPPTTEPPTTVPPTTEPPTTEPPTTKPASPSTYAKARVSCPDAAVIIDLTNSGTAPGTYTVTFTPDGSPSATKIVTVAPGADQTVSMPIAPGTGGVLDIRSSTETVIDGMRLTSTCAIAGKASAKVDCAAKKLVVTVTNDGDAASTYTLTWTPEAGTATSRAVNVAAGQTVTENVDVTTPVRGTVDVRSGPTVLLDRQRIDEPCSSPKTTGSARFDCTKNQVVVTLRNEGDAAGTYAISFTPDGATAATTSASVPARSESTFALTVNPPRSGTVDVRSGSEIVIDGKRVEVVCPTSTIAPTTTVTVAPTTTVRPEPGPRVLAATGSESSLLLAAIGVSLFMLGLITLELRTVPDTERRRRS